MIIPVRSICSTVYIIILILLFNLCLCRGQQTDFLKNRPSIVSTLQPQQSYLLNYTIDLSFNYGIFYLNNTNLLECGFELLVFNNVEGRVYNWPSLIQNNKQIIIIHRDLENVNNACNHNNVCVFSIAIRNKLNSALTYSYSEYDTITTISYHDPIKHRAPYNQWIYYAIRITRAKLDVLITLLPDQTRLNSNVDLYLSQESDILNFAWPKLNEPSTFHAKNAELNLVINNDNNDNTLEGIYILGIYGTEPGFNSYTLTIVNNYNNDTSVSPFTFSLFAILCIVIVVFLLFAMCFSWIAKKRRMQRQQLLLQALRQNHQLNLQFIQDLDENNRNNNNNHNNANDNGDGNVINNGLNFININGQRVNVGNVSIHIVYNSLIRNQIQQNINNANRNTQNQPATQAELDELKIIQYKNGMYTSDDSRCSICLGEYCVDDNIIQLKCMHHFCNDCIIKWLKTHRHCPVCRQDIAKAHNKFNRTATSPLSDNEENNKLINHPSSIQMVELNSNNNKNNNENKDNNNNISNTGNGTRVAIENLVSDAVPANNQNNNNSGDAANRLIDIPNAVHDED